MIDGENLFVALFGQDAVRIVQASIVNEDIDPGMLIQDMRCSQPYIVQDREISLDDFNLIPVPEPECGLDTPGLLLIAADKHQIRPTFGQSVRRLEPHTRSSPGDDAELTIHAGFCRLLLFSGVGDELKFFGKLHQDGPNRNTDAGIFGNDVGTRGSH